MKLAKDYKELSTEKLKEYSSIITGICCVLAFVTAFLFNQNLSHSKTGFDLLVMPLTMLIILIVNIYNIIEMKKEVKSREIK